MKLTDVNIDKIALKLIEAELLDVYGFCDSPEKTVIMTLGRISAIIDFANETKKAMQELKGA